MPGWVVYIVGGVESAEDVGARRGLLLRELSLPLGVELLARVEARKEALRGVSSRAEEEEARVKEPVELEPK
jgi:hypothetical protein